MKKDFHTIEYYLYKLVREYNSNSWHLLLPFYNQPEPDYKCYYYVHVYKKNVKKANFRIATQAKNNYNLHMQTQDIDEMSDLAKKSFIDLIFNIKIENEMYD